MQGRMLMMVACLASLAACAKSADTRLEHADKAAEKAREKDEDAREAANDAQKAKVESNEAQNDAQKAVRKERDAYRERLEKEIAAVDAKTAPDKKTGATISQVEAQRLAARRAVLDRDLKTVGTGTDRDWPQIKARIDADLDAK